MRKKETTKRIEISLPNDQVFLDALEELRVEDGRLMKQFLENIIIRHVKKRKIWKK